MHVLVHLIQLHLQLLAAVVSAGMTASESAMDGIHDLAVPHKIH